MTEWLSPILKFQKGELSEKVTSILGQIWNEKGKKFKNKILICLYSRGQDF